MNYIGITNWSEFPDVKGIMVSDGRLIRGFCFCGYVDKAIFTECPCCGNKEFVHAKKTIRKYQLSPCRSNYYDDTLQIDEITSHYDIVRTQSSDTRIVFRTTRNYATAISSCGYDRVKEFFNDPQFNTFEPYVVAKTVYDYYKGASWSEVVRVCMQFHRANPSKFSTEVVLNELDQMGENMPSKLRTLSNMPITNNPYDVVVKLDKLPNALRHACDNPSVFYDVLYNKFTNVQFLYDEILYLVHAYWKSGYIAAQDETSIFKSISNIGMDRKSIPSFIKFFKEQYAAIAKSSASIDDFLCQLKNSTELGVKDFFLDTNVKIVSKAYKSKDIDNALKDVYQNPASFFISLVNS